MFSYSKHTNELALFDIRLKSTHKDTILLKGSEIDSPSTPINGSVVFSLSAAHRAPLAVKKISLKLIGTFKLEFFEVIPDRTGNSNAVHSIPVKEEKTIFECYWDNLLVNPNGKVKIIDGQPITEEEQRLLGGAMENTTTTGENNNNNNDDDNNDNSYCNNDQPQVIANESGNTSRHNIFRLLDLGHSSHNINNNTSLSSSTITSTATPVQTSVTSDTSLPRRLGLIPKTKSMSSLSLSKKSKNFIRSHNSSTNFVTLSDNCGVLGTPFHDLGKLNSESLESKSFVLPQANYELPFNVIIPGQISETVEGLKGGSILYKFQATMHKSAANPNSSNHFAFFQSGGSSKIIKNKYIRVFRTLPAETFFIPQDMTISNCWPSKVQYIVEVPSKYISIGSKFMLKIKLIPLLKKLKLGKITLSVIEYYAFKGSKNTIYDDNHRVMQKVISPDESDEIYQNVYNEVDDDNNNNNSNTNGDQNEKILPSDDTDTHIDIQQDSWTVTTYLQIPAHLKDVTQDCDLKNDLIKVRHKLKLKLVLINPDNHLSELRANLPIILFVNPNIEIFGRRVALDDSGKTHFRSLEDRLFSNTAANSTEHLPLGLGPSTDQLIVANSLTTNSDSALALPHPAIATTLGFASPSGLATPTLGIFDAEGTGSNRRLIDFAGATAAIAAATAVPSGGAGAGVAGVGPETMGSIILNEIAPPHYERHVYDRVYNPNGHTSGRGSTTGSTNQERTPSLQGIGRINDDTGYPENNDGDNNKNSGQNRHSEESRQSGQSNQAIAPTSSNLSNATNSTINSGSTTGNYSNKSKNNNNVSSHCNNNNITERFTSYHATNSGIKSSSNSSDTSSADSVSRNTHGTAAPSTGADHGNFSTELRSRLPNSAINSNSSQKLPNITASDHMAASRSANGISAIGFRASTPASGVMSTVASSSGINLPLMGSPTANSSSREALFTSPSLGPVPGTPLSAVQKLSLDELSKVPSYSQAIEQHNMPSFNSEPAPIYYESNEPRQRHTNRYSIQQYGQTGDNGNSTGNGNRGHHLYSENSSDMSGFGGGGSGGFGNGG